MLKIVTSFTVLCLLCACKADDAFVVGGGPKPNTNIQLANRIQDDSPDADAAGIDVAAASINSIVNTDTGLAAGSSALEHDLTMPILHAAGDTLLLVGTINNLGGTLQRLTDTTVLIGNTVHSLQQALDIASVTGLIGITQDDAGPVGGLLATVNNTVSTVSGDGNLLGGLEATVTGLVGGVNDNGQLLGGVTDTVGVVVNDTTGSLNGMTGGLTGSAEILGGVTDTVGIVVNDTTSSLNDVTGSLTGDGEILGDVTDTLGSTINAVTGNSTSNSTGGSDPTTSSSGGLLGTSLPGLGL